MHKNGSVLCMDYGYKMSEKETFFINRGGEFPRLARWNFFFPVSNDTKPYFPAGLLTFKNASDS